jgi:hypothetical protein
VVCNTVTLTRVALDSQGPVNLKKGSVAYLPREEIEPYVREGKMEIIRHT